MKSKIYVYEEIIEKIISMIRQTHIDLGSKIPSSRNLAKMFNCNYHTIRKSISIMIERGILESRRGSGIILKAPLENLETRKQSKISFREKNLLGIIVNYESDTFSNDLFLHYLKIAEERGYKLVVHPLAAFDESSLLLPAKFSEQGCNGIIISGFTQKSNMDKFKDFLKNSEIPVALPFQHPQFPDLCYDTSQTKGITSRREMSFACEYFDILGYKNIVFLTTKQSDNIKENEYIRIMKKKKYPENIKYVDAKFKNMGTIADEISSLKKVAAVICYDDDYALLLMMELYKRGISIPSDVAILGCNDNQISALLSPALSSFKFPFSYLVNSMLDHILRLAGENIPFMELPLPMPVIRESCSGKIKLKGKRGKTISDLTERVANEIF